MDHRRRIAVVGQPAELGDGQAERGPLRTVEPVERRLLDPVVPEADAPVARAQDEQALLERRSQPGLDCRPVRRGRGGQQVELDLAEGADVVMVKPAMSYLDVLSDVAAISDVPVWAYQVSGEYAMIEAAAANGWIDREAAIVESVTGIVRAGADAVLTYWAVELANDLLK